MLNILQSLLGSGSGAGRDFGFDTSAIEPAVKGGRFSLVNKSALFGTTALALLAAQPMVANAEDVEDAETSEYSLPLASDDADYDDLSRFRFPFQQLSRPVFSPPAFRPPVFRPSPVRPTLYVQPNQVHRPMPVRPAVQAPVRPVAQAQRPRPLHPGAQSIPPRPHANPIRPASSTPAILERPVTSGPIAKPDPCSKQLENSESHVTQLYAEHEMTLDEINQLVAQDGMDQLNAQQLNAQLGTNQLNAQPSPDILTDQVMTYAIPVAGTVATAALLAEAGPPAIAACLKNPSCSATVTSCLANPEQCTQTATNFVENFLDATLGGPAPSGPEIAPIQIGPIGAQYEIGPIALPQPPYESGGQFIASGMGQLAGVLFNNVLSATSIQPQKPLPTSSSQPTKPTVGNLPTNVGGPAAGFLSPCHKKDLADLLLLTVELLTLEMDNE